MSYENIVIEVRKKIVECRDKIYGRLSPTSIFVNDDSKLSFEEQNEIYENIFMEIDHLVFDINVEEEMDRMTK